METRDAREESEARILTEAEDVGRGGGTSSAEFGCEGESIISISESSDWSSERAV